MVAKTLVALLFATAVMGCRGDGKQIVIVHLLQDRAGVADYLAAEAFAEAVIRAVLTNPDCGPVLIARNQRRDSDPLQDLMRRPHWDLTIAWDAEDMRQSWMLAADYKVLREGTGGAQDIGRAVCLQSGEADGASPGMASAR
jgi:hypothetical protein